MFLPITLLPIGNILWERRQFWGHMYKEGMWDSVQRNVFFYFQVTKDNIRTIFRLAPEVFVKNDNERIVKMYALSESWSPWTKLQ
jgi:hypothetical protein